MKISQFSQTLLLLFILLLILPFIIAYGLQNNLGEFFYSDLYFHAVTLMIIPIAILAGFSCVVDLLCPFYFTLRKLNPRPVDSSLIPQTYQEMCKSFELNSTPLLLVSEAAETPFSLGIHKGKSMIILPKYVLNFKEDEKESVIAHELWHIKTDVEAAYFWLFEMVGFGLFIFFSGIALFLISVEHAFLGWWQEQIIIETSFYVAVVDLYWVNIYWILFVVLTLPYCFSRFAMLFRTLSGYPAYLRYDHREYLADTCASLVTKNPAVMATSIVNSARNAFFKRIEQSFVQKIGFISQPIAQKIQATTWSQIFHPKFTKKKPPALKYRIALLHLLDSLLTLKVKLKWKRKPDKIITRLIIRFIFFASPIDYGKIFKNISYKRRKEIIDYMWANRDTFNLSRCAETIGIGRQEVFLVFILLLMEGIIDIEEPKIDAFLK